MPMNKIIKHLNKASISLDKAIASIKDNKNYHHTEENGLLIADMMRMLKEMRESEICKSNESGKILAKRWNLTESRISQIRSKNKQGK